MKFDWDLSLEALLNVAALGGATWFASKVFARRLAQDQFRVKLLKNLLDEPVVYISEMIRVIETRSPTSLAVLKPGTPISDADNVEGKQADREYYTRSAISIYYDIVIIFEELNTGLNNFKSYKLRENNTKYIA